MNTAKKRILSLTLTICLALSMMLTLSACGKKNLEEYFNTDTMQKLVTSSIEQYESQGTEPEVAGGALRRPGCPGLLRHRLRYPDQRNRRGH